MTDILLPGRPRIGGRKGARFGVFSAPAPPAFSPTSVSGLVGWYDFSDATKLFTDTARTTPVASDGDAIAGVADKSGQANHLSQSTAGKRPLYKTGSQNSLSAGRWDATDDALKSVSYTGGSLSTATIIAVGKTTSGSGNAFWDGLAERVALYAAGNWKMYPGPFTGSASDTSYHIFAGIWNAPNSALYVGGGAANTGGDTGAITMTGVTLGDLNEGGGSLSGDLGDFAVYGSALSLANVNLLGSYFSTKWNLTWSTAT